MYSNIIQVYRTKSGYAVYKDRRCLRRVWNRRHAFRIARQVYEATKKVAGDEQVYFDDFTWFVSEV